MATVRGWGLLDKCQDLVVGRAGIADEEVATAVRFLLAPDDGGPSDPTLEQVMEGGADQGAAEMRAAVRELCEAELSALPTTMEEDVQRLKTLRMGAAAELKGDLQTAIAFRVEKKAVLRACIEAMA